MCYAIEALLVSALIAINTITVGMVLLTYDEVEEKKK